MNWKRSLSQKKNADRGGRVEVTQPRVVRVTPEGRLVYDPASVVQSEPAKKHLKELEENNPTKHR